jgi:hypothetical protein
MKSSSKSRDEQPPNHYFTKILAPLKVQVLERRVLDAEMSSRVTLHRDDLIDRCG